jgi:hypothetical protein
LPFCVGDLVVEERISMKKLIVLSAAFSLLWSCAVSSTPAAVRAPATVEELKAEKLKNLTKRDPRAADLFAKAQARVDKMKQANADPGLLSRLQAALDQIAFASSGMSDPRIKTDMEILEAIGKDQKVPTAEELAPLQERYKKVCSQFDDIVFNKELERAFHIHDKMVRFTALGLWDKDKISSELERIEGLIGNAPDLPYGKAQLLDTCKNKRLAFVPKLVYVGSSCQESMYLTGDRRSFSVVDEGCGASLNMEMAEHIIQGPDGKLCNLNECNDPCLGLPFSPPLSLWAKERMMEGRVPAILLKIVDSQVKESNPAFAGAAGKSDFISVADIASGKLDDYLKTNLSFIAADKMPVLLGLFSDFDREAAANSFGADGRTPFYSLLDTKLASMPESKRAEEIRKRCEKGAYTGNKGNSAELCNKYGDPAIPDGPERVRDAWKRVQKLIDGAGNSSVSLFSYAGSFHGNKNAGKFPGEADAGNQAWNKLEYYWPGPNVIDWLGINATGSDPGEDPKGPNLMEALDSFMAEQRSSSWQATPVMLVSPAPARSKAPLSESAWLTTVFTRLVPSTFPNILAVFVNIPDQITLWSVEGKSAFRSYVSSNKFYNFKLRFKNLNAPAAPASPSSPAPSGG